MLFNLLFCSPMIVCVGTASADKIKELVKKVDEIKLKSSNKSSLSSSSAGLNNNNKSSGKSGKMKLKQKGRSAVNPDSGHDSDGHILDEGGKDIYNVVLNLADITRNSNSYYFLQLIEGDNKVDYYVFRAWGRIGADIGGNK